MLAGAGVSIPSGLASGQIFNHNLWRELLPRDGFSHELDPIRRWHLRPRRRPLVRFEQLVGILRDLVDPQLSILGFMEVSWQPTALHRWLVEALHRRALLLTTNLESLIEIAYYQDTEHFPPQVADADEWVSCLSAIPDHAVFKLHGTLRRCDELAGVATKVATGPTTPFATETVAATLDRVGTLVANPSTFAGGFVLPEFMMLALKEIVRDRDLLVVGYSGSDDFDVLPSLRQLKPHYRRVVWVDHVDKDEIRCQRLADLQIVRGRTTTVLGRLFPDWPPGEGEAIHDAAERFASFLDGWRRTIGLDDPIRRVICGEVLRQAGHPWAAICLWDRILAEGRSSIGELAPRLELLAGQTCADCSVPEPALELLKAAERGFTAPESHLDRATARVGQAMALRNQALSTGDPPNEALTCLANVVPALFELHQTHYLSYPVEAWPSEKRPRVAAEQRQIETTLMRSGLILSRIARPAGLLQSRELVEDVMGRYETVPELLDDLSRFGAIPQDKLLWIDYLAESSLNLLALGRSDEFMERWRGLYHLGRLLHLDHQLALYHLELADSTKAADPELVSRLYTRARILFRKARFRQGYLAAVRLDAVARGEAPNSALSRARFETTLDDWWLD